MGEENKSHSLETESIKGRRITMSVICHENKKCKEIIIDSPKFSFKCWLLWSVFFYSIGFYYRLHFQDVKFMLCLTVLLIILLIKISFKVKQESLLVIASVGVQLTTKFASGRTHSMFYDTSVVHDIVINEGISVHQVIYYICLLLHNCSEKNKITEIVPLFTCSWPPLSILRRIRKELKPLFVHRHDQPYNEGIKNEIVDGSASTDPQTGFS